MSSQTVNGLTCDGASVASKAVRGAATTLTRGALAGSLFLAWAASVEGSTSPNILFIMADDHAWQAVSAYGESRHLIQTPNIDRLARAV